MIGVTPTSTEEETKVALSSYRQPRLKDAKESYYHQEAREYLRSKLIGQTVQVSMEYTKPASSDGFDERHCGTINMGTLNVAEALISKGLGAVWRHRKDDESRSHFYDDLLIAEDRAKTSKKGIWSDRDPPVVRINDASESATKARMFLSGFKRQSARMQGVVEYVANGGRVKVYLPKEQCKLTLVLGGVRVPRPAGPGGAGSGDLLGQEAADFVTRRILQHDVELEVENVDKTGGFIGSIFHRGQNLAMLLLERGLATVHSYSADQSAYTNQLYATESKAKQEKNGLWALPEFSATGPNATKQQGDMTVVSDKSKRWMTEVAVSEIVDAGHFYIQALPDNGAGLVKLMQDLASHATKSGEMASVGGVGSLKMGELVAAKSTYDEKWYRARVKRVTGGGGEKMVQVFYVDYGNTESVPAKNVTGLPSQFGLSTLSAQAQEVFLAFVRVPALGDDTNGDAVGDEYGVDAVEYATSLISQVKKWTVCLEYKRANALYVSMYDATDVPSSPSEKSGDESRLFGKSLNSKLVRAGFAQGARLPLSSSSGSEESAMAGLKKKVEMVKKEEQGARQKRSGMFEYGDFKLGGHDEDEEY